MAKKRLLWVAAAIFLTILYESVGPARGHTGSLPYYADSGFQPHWTRCTHQVGEFELRDQLGKLFDQEHLRGRVSVLHFFFASCGELCPTLFGNLKPVGNEPGVQIISLSVDPQSDSVERLAGYARERGLGPNWHLLTGPRETIYGLARDSLFCAEDITRPPGSQEFLHTEKVFLVDQDLHLRGLYNGTLRLEMERLARDIHTLTGPGVPGASAKGELHS